MKKSTLLVLIAIIAMSTITIFSAWNAPKSSKKNTLKQWHVNTLAGSTKGHIDGKGITAKFNTLHAVVIDPDGTTLYVADTNNNCIRMITLPSGNTTIDGDGTNGYKDDEGTVTTFNLPRRITIAQDGITPYVADLWNNRIRKLEYK